MSVRRANAPTQKIMRGSSIPNNNNKIKSNPTQLKKTQNKDSKLIDRKRNIKVDYNSNHYFYNDEEYYDDYAYNKYDYYDRNQKRLKYNNETNDSYVTVEQEDGHIKYIPKNYVEYKGSSPPLYTSNNNKIDYYEENSEDSENNYNNEGDNLYYENEEEYEQDIIEDQPPEGGYNKYHGINKYYLTQDNNANSNKIKKNQNVISRPINHQINFTKDMKRKGRTPGGNLHNCGNNTTTTNNTYNNNIYYINPINVKNKSKLKKEDTANKLKRTNTNKKNTVYKNVDIMISKKKPPKEKDYFKIHNIERSKRQKYHNAAILIQSIFRGYLIKIKLYNNVNLYVCCKRGIDILEKLIYKKKKYYWKIYKNIISNMLYNELLNSKISLNILKEYLRSKKNNSKEKKNASFHKELGDSFNIVVDRKQKENNEKKLKCKLNDVMKENKELKNQLVDNKNIEEKMKNLIDENKKNQNINAIIMKDNQQLAKKLKDIQDYRNSNLFVENQSSVDLTQKQQIQIEELIKNNEIYLDKLKKYLLYKIINKKNNDNISIIKEYFNKYKKVVEKIKVKNLKKNIYLKICINNIGNKMKFIKQKCFWDLYYESIILNNEKKSTNCLKIEILKNLVNNKENYIQNILNKKFFKYYSNVIKYNNKDTQKLEEKKLEEDKKLSKMILLKKIFIKYENSIKLIYKVFLEKWNLKSKIMGMRAAARDKKKKRKLKKKNNKLLYEKHFGIAEKKNPSNSIGPKFCKSIHEFSYIVSNGTVIKESSSNENAEVNLKNIKASTSSDKINKVNNKLDKKNVNIKKINSVNEILTQKELSKQGSKEENKAKDNNNCNEDSEEDSGDSFGLEDNNSD